GRVAARLTGSSSTARRSPAPEAWPSIWAMRRGSIRSPTASANIRGRRRSLAIAPHSKLASAGIDEVEPPSAGKAEDRLGDRAARLDHRIEGAFEIVDTDHREWGRERFARLTI